MELGLELERELWNCNCNDASCVVLTLAVPSFECDGPGGVGPAQVDIPTWECCSAVVELDETVHCEEQRDVDVDRMWQNDAVVVVGSSHLPIQSDPDEDDRQVDEHVSDVDVDDDYVVMDGAGRK